MPWPDRARWERLWRALGAAGEPGVWHDRLVAAYAEPQRRYHDGTHIAECLAELDGARQLVRDPVAVEAAIWFHDAVYDPRAGDNEERSAGLAEVCLAQAGGRPELRAAVADLVLATKTHKAEPGSDAAVLIDIDLAILGRDAVRFRRYDRQIRAEYAWVPEDVYRSKRAEVLGGFLARDRIYATAQFHAAYEQQARANLAIAIRELTA